MKSCNFSFPRAYNVCICAFGGEEMGTDIDDLIYGDAEGRPSER